MKKIYRSLSVRESIHDDMLSHECFFDEEAFAEKFNIDGKMITGLLIHSGVRREYDGERGASGQNEIIFICRSDEVKNVRVNNVVRLNGRAYYVSSAEIIQGLYWKIRMLVNE